MIASEKNVMTKGEPNHARHFGLPSFRPTQRAADPAPLRLAGQAGWNLTAKIAFFVTIGFVRFGSESRPANSRYPGKERRDLREPLARSKKHSGGAFHETKK